MDEQKTTSRWRNRIRHYPFGSEKHKQYRSHKCDRTSELWEVVDSIGENWVAALRRTRGPRKNVEAGGGKQGREHNGCSGAERRGMGCASRHGGIEFFTSHRGYNHREVGMTESLLLLTLIRQSEQQ
jgi:hypothetical protein